MINRGWIPSYTTNGLRYKLGNPRWNVQLLLIHIFHTSFDLTYEARVSQTQERETNLGRDSFLMSFDL